MLTSSQSQQRKTARNHSESRRIDLFPKTKNCPECHQPFKEKYHKQRWIVQLNGELQVVSHCLGCQNRECSHFIAVYRPEEENLLALKGYTFGLDVIVYIGQLRYRENKKIEAIHNQLTKKISISLKEVALLCEVFLAIEKLIEQVKQLGIPIIGVISDQQHSICLAIKRQLPGIPHQLCQYHYLKDLAQPACERDRHDSRVPLRDAKLVL